MEGITHKSSQSWKDLPIKAVNHGRNTHKSSLSWKELPIKAVCHGKNYQ